MPDLPSANKGAAVRLPRLLVEGNEAATATPRKMNFTPHASTAPIVVFLSLTFPDDRFPLLWAIARV